MADETGIDVTRLSDEELHAIRNDVLRTLAERARAGALMTPRYDRHGSAHSKHSPNVAEE